MTTSPQQFRSNATGPVLTEKRGAVAVITLNRPDKRNAISAKKEKTNGVPKPNNGRKRLVRSLVDQNPGTNRPLTKQCTIPIAMVTDAIAITAPSNPPPAFRTTGTNAICNTLPMVLIPL